MAARIKTLTYLRYLSISRLEFSLSNSNLVASAIRASASAASASISSNYSREVKRSNLNPLQLHVTRPFVSSGQDPITSTDTPRETKGGDEEEEEKHEHDESEEEESGEFVNPETGERGGPKGPEPTRYGDWERGGRCSDF